MGKEGRDRKKHDGSGCGRCLTRLDPIMTLLFLELDHLLRIRNFFGHQNNRLKEANFKF